MNTTRSVLRQPSNLKKEDIRIQICLRTDPRRAQGSSSGEFQVSKGVSNGKMKISRSGGELQVSKGVSNGKMKISGPDQITDLVRTRGTPRYYWVA